MSYNQYNDRISGDFDGSFHSREEYPNLFSPDQYTYGTNGGPSTSQIWEPTPSRGQEHLSPLLREPTTQSRITIPPADLHSPTDVEGWYSAQTASLPNTQGGHPASVGSHPLYDEDRRQLEQASMAMGNPTRGVAPPERSANPHYQVNISVKDTSGNPVPSLSCSGSLDRTSVTALKGWFDLVSKPSSGRR